MITSTALGFKHAHYHNQYFDSYVRYGIIGVLIALAIFMSPYVLYAKYHTTMKHLTSDYLWIVIIRSHFFLKSRLFIIAFLKICLPPIDCCQKIALY